MSLQEVINFFTELPMVQHELHHAGLGLPIARKLCQPLQRVACIKVASNLVKRDAAALVDEMQQCPVDRGKTARARALCCHNFHATPSVRSRCWSTALGRGQDWRRSNIPRHTAGTIVRDELDDARLTAEYGHHGLGSVAGYTEAASAATRKQPAPLLTAAPELDDLPQLCETTQRLICLRLVRQGPEIRALITSGSMRPDSCAPRSTRGAGTVASAAERDRVTWLRRANMSSDGSGIRLGCEYLKSFN